MAGLVAGCVRMGLLAGLWASGLCALGQDSVLVKEVFLVGAKKTREWIVFQEMPFQKGDRIPVARLDELLEKAEQNIYNLNLFTEVKLNTDTLDGGLYVFVNVKERWFFIGAPFVILEERNSFDVIQALLAGDLHRASYGLNFTWRNMTGHNETFYFFGQAGFSRQFGLDYQRPSLFRRQNIDLLLNLELSRNPEIIIGTENGKAHWQRMDSEPLQRSISGYAGLRKRFNPNTSLTLRLGYSEVEMNDSLPDFRLGQEPVRYLSGTNLRERYPTWMLFYVADYRDVRAYPLDGWKLQLYARGTGPRSLGSTAFMKAGFSFSQFFPLGQRWNLGYGVQAVTTLGDALPFYEKSFLGLSYGEFPFMQTELRGYEPYTMGGTSLLLGKAELKYALIRRQTLHFDFMPIPSLQAFPVGMYLTGFWDNGWFTDRSPSRLDTRFADQWLAGYGVGLNFITLYDFIFRVEYSVNRAGRGGLYLHSTLPIR